MASTSSKDSEDHPDATYIKRDDIGLVIAKGMAVMYKAKPKNPVDYLAKWLLNYAAVEKEASKGIDRKEKVKELLDRHEYDISVAKLREDERKQAEKEREDVI